MGVRKTLEVCLIGLYGPLLTTGSKCDALLLGTEWFPHSTFLSLQPTLPLWRKMLRGVAKIYSYYVFSYTGYNAILLCRIRLLLLSLFGS